MNRRDDGIIVQNFTTRVRAITKAARRTRDL